MKNVLLSLFAVMSFSQVATAGNVRPLQASEVQVLQEALTSQGSKGTIRSCRIDLDAVATQASNQWSGPVHCWFTEGSLRGTLDFNKIVLENGMIVSGSPLDVWLVDSLEPRY